MLTIQPNFRNTSFRGESALIDKATYEEKQRYYTQQKREFEEIINDEHIPETMKKGAKVFKVASEGILEGWAVAWGASKGADMMKTGMVKASASRTAKWAKNILKPVGKMLVKAGENISKFVSENIDKLAKSEFVQKLDGNKFGHYIVEAFKGLGKLLKYANEGLKNLWTKVAGKSDGSTYDKAANAVSKTLGVGAGLGGAYNAARAPKKAEQKSVNDDENYSYKDEVDEINDGYDDDLDNVEDED